jgi:hypothetical protein
MTTYSIDAARAQRAEAVGEPFTFTYGIKEFVLPLEFSLDMVEAISALPAQDSIPGLRAMLTALLEDQAKDAGIGTMSGEDLSGLFDAYFDHTGIRLGESVPSSSSSKSTARLSKPTSKRSTKSSSRTSGAGRSAGGASKS